MIARDIRIKDFKTHIAGLTDNEALLLLGNLQIQLARCWWQPEKGATIKETNYLKNRIRMLCKMIIKRNPEFDERSLIIDDDGLEEIREELDKRLALE